MAGYWSVTNRAATGNATVTQTAPSASTPAGAILRVRGLFASNGAAALTLTLTDSVSGAIWQMDFPAGGGSIAQPNLDLRSGVGSNLTLAWSGTNTTVPTDVNMQGDFVSIGYPMYQV